jgi:predicted transcriptional regulator
MAAVGGTHGFGELEAAVMDVLWSHGAPATVRDVLTELLRTRRLAYTTVMTVMDNLYKKGWLTREPMAGRAYAYRTVMSREAYLAQRMRQALDGSADRAAVLMRFVDEMTEAEAAAVREALAAYERRTTEPVTGAEPSTGAKP